MVCWPSPSTRFVFVRRAFHSKSYVCFKKEKHSRQSHSNNEEKNVKREGRKRFKDVAKLFGFREKEFRSLFEHSKIMKMKIHLWNRFGFAKLEMYVLKYSFMIRNGS